MLWPSKAQPVGPWFGLPRDKCCFWPWRRPVEVSQTNFYWLYAKSWLRDMGVRFCARPQQGVLSPCQREGDVTGTWFQKWHQSPAASAASQDRGVLSTVHPFASRHSKSLKCYGPPKLSLLGPDLACPETCMVSDREDGRLRSSKQTFSDSTRKVGLETWGSDSVPDHSKGTWLGCDFQSFIHATMWARLWKPLALLNLTASKRLASRHSTVLGWKGTSGPGHIGEGWQTILKLNV
jgi:hypothetical protein